MKATLLTIILSTASFLATADVNETYYTQADTQTDNYRADSDFAINATVSPLNFPLPLAFGISGYYKIDNKWSVGVDYLQSSIKFDIFGIDIGETKETSFTLQAKRYYGESFNLKMGLGARTTSIVFGESLLGVATSNFEETAAELNAKYVRLAIGNTWNYQKQFTIEVDWLTLDIPFNAQVVTSSDQYADNEEDAELIRDAEAILKYFPSGSILKVNAGIVF